MPLNGLWPNWEISNNMKKLTKKQQKEKVLSQLRGALRIVNIGYPWYGVPITIHMAIKYIKNSK